MNDLKFINVNNLFSTGKDYKFMFSINSVDGVSPTNGLVMCYKVKEIKSNKVFGLIGNCDFIEVALLNEIKRKYGDIKVRYFNQAMTSSYVKFQHNGGLSYFEFEPMLDDNHDSSLNFSDQEIKKYEKILLLSKINFTNISWLNEIQPSVCNKCGYSNPDIDYNPKYICYGCKIGY